MLILIGDCSGGDLCDTGLNRYNPAMPADITPDMPTLDIREQIARIDNLLIDSQKKQREFHLSIWQVVATVTGGAAALLGAGVAAGVTLARFLGH